MKDLIVPDKYTLITPEKEQMAKDVADMVVGLNIYAEVAMQFDICKGYPVVYAALGLTGEAGEFADKVKKILRDEKGDISKEARIELVKELGDTLWYVVKAAKDLGVNLSDVAMCNLEKLESRRERGVISGSGDNR
jgi:NTP pyrophosphatase (non-canonical NTP hydrolase)